MGCQKTLVMVLPSDVMPAITTTAISTARSPYSSKSCPSSRRTRWLTAASTRFMETSQRMMGRDAGPAPFDDRYADGANAVAIFVKIVLTLEPAEVMATTQTSAMSATSSAYSSRSCPSSWRASVRRYVTRLMTSSRRASPRHVRVPIAITRHRVIARHHPPSQRPYHDARRAIAAHRQLVARTSAYDAAGTRRTGAGGGA